MAASNEDSLGLLRAVEAFLQTSSLHARGSGGEDPFETLRALSQADQLAKDGADVATRVRDSFADAPRAAHAWDAMRTTKEGSVVVWKLVRAATDDLDGTVAVHLRARGPEEENDEDRLGAARTRALHGPVSDALESLALSGDATWLGDPETSADHATVELRLWQASELDLRVPALGAWLLERGGLDRFVTRGARGSLRARSLAARTLAVATGGLAPSSWEGRGEPVYRAVRQLIQYPEPAVWIPAARAVGRLAESMPELVAWLRGWVQADNPGRRRRALVAIANLAPSATTPFPRFLDEQLDASNDPWMLASFGPALSTLATSNPRVYERVLERLDPESCPPAAAWSLSQGLSVLHVRGDGERVSRAWLERARARAIACDTKSETDAALWRDVVRQTDFLDDEPPAPDDADRLLKHMVARFARARAELVPDRVRGVMRSLRSDFTDSLDELRSEHLRSAKERGVALHRMESVCRALATGLWEPLLQAAGGDRRQLAVSVGESARAIRDAATACLVAEKPAYSMHRSAIRALAASTLAVSAYGDAPEPGRGAAILTRALETIPWLGEVDDKQLRRFRKTLGDALFHVLDPIRRADDADDTLLMSRFVAWWSLCSEAHHLRRTLERTDEAAAGASDPRWTAFEISMRIALNPDDATAMHGGWSEQLATLLRAFGVGSSRLARAYAMLGSTLASAHGIEGDASRLRKWAFTLAGVTNALVRCFADPVHALEDGVLDVTLTTEHRTWIEQLDHPEVVQGRRTQLLRSWTLGLVGPTATILERAIENTLDSLVRARASTPATAEPIAVFENRFEASRILGEGGQGIVYLARDRRYDRLCVVKVPRLSLLPSSEAERRFVMGTLERETAILQSLSHPNVAGFIHRGVTKADVPFLVLDYMQGVDLETYGGARRLDVAALAPLVDDVCNGLRAIHRAGLVHRDLKPGNVFVRLDLEPGERFDPKRHTDAEEVRVLSAVLLDFGISGVAGDPDEVGEHPMGTLGYLPPEQAKLHLPGPKADVYSLAATVYWALTGRRFFEELKQGSALVAAHMLRPPLAKDEASAGLGAEVLRLLRDASTVDPEQRVGLDEFQSRFATL